MTTAPVEHASPQTDIVARPDRWNRGKRLIFAFVLLAAGPWFAYDGWVKWPRHNAEARARDATNPPHSDTDLMIQKVLGVSLPPIGLAYLAWILYSSRGVYRLRNDMVEVPGHPIIPVDAITQIDLQKWDRKGIAYLDYNHNGRTGRFKLDDFIYDRKPTDDILDQIKARIAPEEPPAEAT